MRCSVSLTTRENITVRVGGESFQVCESLLLLHSGHFRELINSETSSEHYLENVTPFQFSLFFSWMQHGYLIDRVLSMSQSESDTGLEHLWVVGHYLESPAFQNYIMETLRISGPVQSSQWPTPKQAETVYQLTSDFAVEDGGDSPSQLRKFVAHSIAANNPFEQYERNIEEYREWSELFKASGEINMDVMKAGGKRWLQSKPWEDKNRKQYLIKAKSIDARWERMILKGKNRASREHSLQARKGTVRSELQLAHLSRVDGVNCVNGEVGH
jgi:hypothetical protein